MREYVQLQDSADVAAYYLDDVNRAGSVRDRSRVRTLSSLLILLGRQPSKFCFFFQSFALLAFRNPKVRLGFLFFAQMGSSAKANTVQTRHQDSNIATALLAPPKQPRDGR